MILRLYHVELLRACLQLMPKELQREREIKEVLYHQLCNLRKINTDPRAASHDMAGLTSSLNFNSRGTKHKKPWSGFSVENKG